MLVCYVKCEPKRSKGDKQLTERTKDEDFTVLVLRELNFLRSDFLISRSKSVFLFI